MASPGKADGTRHEIVLRADQVCINCRGKCLRGSRAWWDKATSQVWHVVCPPIAPIAAESYRQPPVSAPDWKRWCQEVAAVFADSKKAKKVEDEKQYEVVCNVCGMEWSGYTNLEGSRHLAMQNRCGGVFRGKPCSTQVSPACTSLTALSLNGSSGST
jgi:hypothetical protein